MSKRPSSIVGFATIVMCGLSGCASLPPDARRELQRAERSYRAGDLRDVELCASRIIHKHPGAVEIGEAYYLRGLALVRRDQSARAKQDFQDAIKLARRRDLISLASASMGMILEQEGAYDQAAPYYQGAIEHADSAGPIDEWWYNLGLCRQRAGDWGLARSAFGRLIQTYPNSRLASQAGTQANWPHDYFTIQCGVFKDAKNAARLLESLAGRGLSPYSENRGGTIAVCVGRFSDHDGAQRVLSSVRKSVPDAYIVP